MGEGYLELSHWLTVPDRHCCKHLVQWLHAAGMEVLGRGQVCVDCMLKEVAWMARESALLFLCLHW